LSKKTVSTIMLILLVTSTLVLAFSIQPVKRARGAQAQGQVCFSVEPVAVPPLTDIDGSANVLEIPPTPLPISQTFTVQIHLRNATLANVPSGVTGVEVHFYFGNILGYCRPVGFVDMLGQPGGVLLGPSIMYGITPGFYDDAGNRNITSPYTDATQYMVAAASLEGGWNSADGLVAKITFQIISQPSSPQSDFYAPLQITFTALIQDVPSYVIQGTVHIDAAEQAQGQVYFSVEPVAVPPLTDINGSANVLETPSTPLPIGQTFTVQIHLRNATAMNVPAGVNGIEMHFYFGDLLSYCRPIEFVDMLGQPGGVLLGPSNFLVYGIYAGLYDRGNNRIFAPYDNAVQYMVAAASTGGFWNSADGLVAKITFQIISQPSSPQSDFYAPLQITFTALIQDVPSYVIQGTLHIDARANGTIYIRADGSITPSTAPILNTANVTYTLTGNIIGGIAVDRDNIIIDGNGHTVQGGGGDGALPWAGIWLEGNRLDVTIKNFQIQNCEAGIYGCTSNSIIIGNNITANRDWGIVLFSSWDNIISGNNITANHVCIALDYSNHNTISGNNALNSKFGICVFSCSNYNSISGNNITCVSEGACGIFVGSSEGGGLSGNYTVGNIISGNNIRGSDAFDIGIDLCANSSIVSGNNVANLDAGIVFDGAYGNIISENNIANNFGGFFVMSPSSSNVIYHNSLINNTLQVYYYEFSTNVWSDGYPSGGNYWSDYNGTDLHSGSYQNETGSDGIGDTRYNIAYTPDIDHYPLMHPWSSLAFSSTSVLCSPNQVIRGSAVALTAIVTGSSATGTITWNTSSVGGNFSQSVRTLSRGSCSTTYIDNYTGSATITALYSGDSNNAPSSGSTTLTVTSGSVYHSEDYTSVQAAINAAPSGATLILAHGFYTESLTINKTLTIIGEEDPPVFSGGASAIYLKLLSGASGTTITGIEITYWPEGILLENASNCRIYGNIFASLGSSGIVFEGKNATNNLVYKNVFEGTPNPISLAGSANGNTFFGNIFTSQTGVTLNVGGSGNIVYGNTISGRQILLNLTNSENNTIYHNNFLATLQTTVISAGNNTWDSGYPGGGNYWSNYLTENPDAAEIGSSGIWNMPYIINGNNTDRYPRMKPWTQASGHCIAVISVAMAKTLVGEGFSCNVTVAVANTGEYAETFNVTAYANATAIGTQQVKNLNVTGYAILTFAWNTTGLRISNYIVSAYASPVPGQTDTSENSFTLGMSSVTVPGDVNGDFKTGLPDLVLLANSYASKPANANWKPNADIDGNNVVGLSDLAILAQHYGQHCP
jgi:parallel beta-helix repeat protein